MRRSLIALALLVLPLSVSACAMEATPGWTQGVPTAVPASQAAPEPTPVPGASAALPDGVIAVSALNVAFEQAAISAPAGTAFTIHFTNKDQGVPHNVDIKDASGASVVNPVPPTVTGPAEVDYQFPALPAGDYAFVCTVHPNMAGKLKVGG